MTILRKLVAMLLVAMAMTLSVATAAQADAGDAAKDWTAYVCDQFELC
jgi:type IV secretory pathway VirB2 component (pilin)